MSDPIENKNNPSNPIIFRVTGCDPSLMAFLPPELRSILMREVEEAGQEEDKKEQKQDTSKEKLLFDYNMVNCDQNLKELVLKLKKSKEKAYGMLLYGVSGSGKSYFGQFLAQELKMPFIKKRCSDLMTKWVGETEQNIAKAFKEAAEKKAILIFDEADSLIFDRKYADKEFQVTGVNEMLTQMESHPYPFICTTNLKDKIDKAALRRFIFKIKYDYMKPENVKAGIKTYFGKGFKLTDEQYKSLDYITAGDYKVAKKKMDILENGEYTSQKIYEYLLKEQNEKDIERGSNEIIL